ncbi:MAG TPA: acyltransferase [Actinoplanes sp.]|nr:acyltransferase [Actinoplanes sp.]
MPSSSTGVAAELAPSPPPRSRAQWADVAKGVCILLVVLWHVIMKHYLRIEWQLPVPIPGAWGAFGDQLLPLRMPVFFTISGLFAAGAAARTWAEVRRSRIATFCYLYVVWFALHTLVFSLVPGFDTLAAHTWRQALEYLTITPTNLWYLLALVVYFVLAKVSLRLPTGLVLGAALLLSAAASAGWLAGPGNRGQLYQNLFFFLAGLRLKPWVQRWAATAGPRLLALCVTAYAGGLLLVTILGAKQWFGVWPALCSIAVLTGIAGAVQLARIPRLSGGLAALGRNTLPIYVMHLPLLALMHLLLLRPLSASGPLPQFVAACVLPVVLTAFLVAVCLYLRRGVLAVGGWWLFELPAGRLPRWGR